MSAIPSPLSESDLRYGFPADGDHPDWPVPTPGGRRPPDLQAEQGRNFGDESDPKPRLTAPAEYTKNIGDQDAMDQA